jgi:hypothetical protein
MNKYLFEESDRAEAQQYFFNSIEDYVSLASNKEVWDELNVLLFSILSKSVNREQLIQKGNFYNVNNRQNFHTICILGLIYIERTKLETIDLLLNVIPIVANIQKVNRGVTKFIIIPFVQKMVSEAIKSEFVGTKKELTEILTYITSTEINSEYPLQAILKKAVDLLEIDIEVSRRPWLYENEAMIN